MSLSTLGRVVPCHKVYCKNFNRCGTKLVELNEKWNVAMVDLCNNGWSTDKRGNLICPDCTQENTPPKTDER